MEIEFESGECYSRRNLSNWYPIPGKRTVVRNGSVSGKRLYASKYDYL